MTGQQILTSFKILMASVGGGNKAVVIGKCFYISEFGVFRVAEISKFRDDIKLQGFICSNWEDKIDYRNYPWE